MVFRLQVPDGTFCLYEHPALAGKQWLFWPADGSIDLALPRIGADQTVSSALNRTARTIRIARRRRQPRHRTARPAR